MFFFLFAVALIFYLIALYMSQGPEAPPNMTALKAALENRLDSKLAALEATQQAALSRLEATAAAALDTHTASLQAQNSDAITAAFKDLRTETELMITALFEDVRHELRADVAAVRAELRAEMSERKRRAKDAAERQKADVDADADADAKEGCMHPNPRYFVPGALGREPLKKGPAENPEMREFMDTMKLPTEKPVSNSWGARYARGWFPEGERALSLADLWPAVGEYGNGRKVRLSGMPLLRRPDSAVHVDCANPSTDIPELEDAFLAPIDEAEGSQSSSAGVRWGERSAETSQTVSSTSTPASTATPASTSAPVSTATPAPCGQKARCTWRTRMLDDSLRKYRSRGGMQEGEEEVTPRTNEPHMLDSPLRTPVGTPMSARTQFPVKIHVEKQSLPCCAELETKATQPVRSPIPVPVGPQELVSSSLGLVSGVAIPQSSGSDVDAPKEVVMDPRVQKWLDMVMKGPFGAQDA